MINNHSYDELPDNIKELIELGLYTEEEAMDNMNWEVYDKEQFEDMLYNCGRNIFTHRYMEEVFDGANFVFIDISDNNITVKCTLYDGHVIEANVNATGMDLDTAYSLCMLKLSISAYEYFNSLIDDDEDISDDDDCMYHVEEEPDCEHCEYFHECCGDMDVVDIDFYSFN